MRSQTTRCDVFLTRSPVTTDSASTRLREAAKAVETAGIDLGSPAAATALEFVLSSAPGRPPAAQGSKTATTPASPDGGLEGAPADRVAASVGVDATALLDHFEFGEDHALVKVASARLPRSKAKQQRAIGFLKLAVDRFGYSRDEVPAADVNVACQDYNLVDQNLPSNLVGNGQLVSRRGQRGAFKYRLSRQGLDRSAEAIRHLVESSDPIVI